MTVILDVSVVFMVIIGSEMVTGSFVLSRVQGKPWLWLNTMMLCQAQRSNMWQMIMLGGWLMAGNIVRYLQDVMMLM